VASSFPGWRVDCGFSVPMKAMCEEERRRQSGESRILSIDPAEFPAVSCRGKRRLVHGSGTPRRRTARTARRDHIAQTAGGGLLTHVSCLYLRQSPDNTGIRHISTGPPAARAGTRRAEQV
jgi:hypothetical protein